MMTSFSNTNSGSSVDVCAMKKAFENVTLDNYYHFNSGTFSWHIMTDDLNLIYVMICKKEYPQRCAYLCLQELQPVFRVKAGQKSFTRKEGGLNSVFRTHLSKICEKYDDIASVDSLASTVKKVDGIKLGNSLPFYYVLFIYICIRVYMYTSSFENSHTLSLSAHQATLRTPALSICRRVVTQLCSRT
jgi:hypothetical protein